MLSDELDAVKVDQSRLMTALEGLLKNEAINLDYAARIRAHVYKALENARTMGRLEARIDYATKEGSC